MPHPDNPRVAIREDVVLAIAANLNGEFPQKHAVHVRPLGESYQLLSGHQRTEAARRAGLQSVWAWVEAIDDAAAFMELVTSNNQGELSPLEIGIHALKAVPKAQGKKSDGLKAYARVIGKTGEYIGQLRTAAEVLAATSKLEFGSFLDKAKHLCAIHALPKPCWQAACEWLAKSDAAVADVEKRVKDANAFIGSFDAGDWADYLPVDKCALAVFTGTDPNNFKRLLAIATAFADLLKEKEDDWYNGLLAKWREWLVTNIGGESWDIKAVQDKKIALENDIWEHEDRSAPSETVNLILADPPWRYDFAETDNRQIENQYPSASVEEICAHIGAKWTPTIADDCVLYLWATAPKLKEALQVMEAWGFRYVSHAVWDKQKIGMGYWWRGQHELLLTGVKGKVSPPEPDCRVSSLFSEPRGRHSEKPECVYAAIEAMFPKATKCEFYQRKPRNGWIGVGNEAAQ